MIRYLENDDQFWKATVLDDVIMIEHGRVGEEPQVDVVDPWEEFQTPPEYALDKVAAPLLEAGYQFVPIPNVVELIEKAHGKKLPQTVRTFFEDERYWKFTGYSCPALGCEVDFTTDAVLGDYDQEHYDRELGQTRLFVPISGRMHAGAPDEQQWIGIDPKEVENPKVYALYTSGEFEVAFDSFEAFLADLRPATNDT